MMGLFLLASRINQNQEAGELPGFFSIILL